MSVNVIELGAEELVTGLAAAQGSISFEQLVSKFGFARAQQLWAEYGVDGLYLDFGGSVGSTTAYAAIDSGSLIYGGAPAAISSTTETALELAQGSELVAGDTGIATYAQGAMQTGTNTAQTTSLLALDVGVVGAALAPILGVAFGVELYENNPQFWTLLSQKLLPFCYPGTTEIPAWLDIVESAIPGVYESKTVIDKRIYDELYSWFQENGWGSQHQASSQLETYIAQPVPITESLYVNYETGYNNDRIRKEYFIVSNGATMTCRVNIPTGYPSQINISVYFASVDPNDGITVTIKTYNKNDVLIDTSVSQKTAGSTYVVTHDGKTSYGSYFVTASNQVDGRYVTDAVNYTLSGNTATNQNIKDTFWTMIYGSITGEVPEGASEWEGDPASTTPYSKQIIYMREDPDNPGSFIPEPVDGLAIAVPDKSTLPQPSVQSTKPENWPEGVSWPTVLEFPWAKPAGYEGDWPETMPWPLPEEKPDWWPSVIPYPNEMPMPAPTVDPEVNPNPNLNDDPEVPTEYVKDTIPGLTTNPTNEVVPSPEENPSIPPDKPNTVFDDPTGGVTNPSNPEVPSGETPTPTLPVVPLPWTPSASSPDGLISVYHPTDAQLKAFAAWLWVTYADPSIQKLWNNPFDGVIGLMELYCTPTDIGVKNIRSGFLDSGVSSQTISRYTSIDCGSITVPEYYGNYLDYSPYSKCHVYLPFVGIVELNVDDIVGHAVNISYKIDEYNGSCIAQITVAKSTTVGDSDIDYSNLMYQFSGNCAVELPLAGGTQSAIRAGMIQAAAYGLSSVIGGVVSGASGNIGGAVSQIGYGAANAIGSLVSAKSSVQHSGSFGSSYGALGVKTPYIIVTRPKQVIVPNYNEIYGYQSHKMVTIGACQGYLRVREVNVASATASDEEKKRIEELLKEGIYIE